MIFSSAGSGALAIAAAVGYRRKSSGVTMFTRWSVVCADRIVAQSSWNGVSRAGSGGQGPRRGFRVAFVMTFASFAITRGMWRRYNIHANGRDARGAGADQTRGRADRRLPLPQ